MSSFLLSAASFIARLLGSRQLREAEDPILPEPAAPVVVDWTQAPDDAVEWVFDERAGKGRWLNGNHKIEEYGIVWEWDPAPSFDATKAMRVRKTDLDEAVRQAARLAATTPPAQASRPRTRL